MQNPRLGGGGFVNPRTLSPKRHEEGHEETRKRGKRTLASDFVVTVSSRKTKPRVAPYQRYTSVPFQLPWPYGCRSRSRSRQHSHCVPSHCIPNPGPTVKPPAGTQAMPVDSVPPRFVSFYSQSFASFWFLYCVFGLRGRECDEVRDRQRHQQKVPSM